MSNYTPTVADFRVAWIEAHKVRPMAARVEGDLRPLERNTEFDRGLAEYHRQVQIDMLERILKDIDSAPDIPSVDSYECIQRELSRLKDTQ